MDTNTIASRIRMSNPKPRIFRLKGKNRRLPHSDLEALAAKSSTSKKKQENFPQFSYSPSPLLSRLAVTCLVVERKLAYRGAPATPAKRQTYLPVGERSRVLPQSKPRLARPAVTQSVELVPTSSPRSASDPRTHRVLICPLYLRKTLKMGGNRLDFPLTRCKLLFGNGLPTIGNHFQAHFSRISAKDDENQPSLKLLFCSRKRNTPAKYHCVFVSCWAFLCRFWSRFLAGPSSSRMGKRPAFFVLR